MAEGRARVSVHVPPTKFFATALASFLYGNGLPCPLALKLVWLCNPDATDEMIDAIHSKYSAWAAGRYVRLSIYWDMQQQKGIWLKGPNGPQEYLPLCTTPTVTGFGVSGKSYIARHRLNYLRRIVPLL